MGFNKERSLTSAEIACFLAGAAAMLMGYSVYSHLKSVQDSNSQTKKSSNRLESKIEDCNKIKHKPNCIH